MGLSRRRFSREFKLGAVRRVEQGATVASIARALEIKPKLLGRWCEEFRRVRRVPSPAGGRRVGRRMGRRIWSVRSASRRWRSIF
jgi:transposase-like protein